MHGFQNNLAQLFISVPLGCKGVLTSAAGVRGLLGSILRLDPFLITVKARPIILGQQLLLDEPI